MGGLIFLMVIATSIWVYFDAKAIGVKKGQLSGIANMGPVGWFFACLGLWIIAFPVYLGKRAEFKRINGVQAGQSPNRSPRLCSHCGKYHEGTPTYCPNCGQRLIGDGENA